MMLAISLITAFFLIGLGFLSVRKPTIISGYNKLNNKQKEVVPKLIRNASIITGLVIFAGGILAYCLNNDIIFLITFVLPLFVMPMYILYKSSGLYNKPTKIIFYFLLIILLVIPLFFLFSSKEPDIKINNNNEISISGLYGENIPFKEIKTISLQENIPSIQLRTNGYALGKVRKGYFIVEGIGNVKLFLSNNRGPYLHILTNDNHHLFINSNDSIQMTKLYNKLKSIK